MKRILALLVLALVAIDSGAQQPSDKETLPDDYCKGSIFLEMCSRMLKEYKETEQALKDAEELRKTVEELRSPDKEQQAKGIADAGKVINSHFNSNPASEVVTDKSVSLIDQFVQRGNELLNKTN